MRDSNVGRITIVLVIVRCCCCSRVVFSGCAQGAVQEFPRGYLDEAVAYCCAAVLLLYANIDAVAAVFFGACEDDCVRLVVIILSDRCRRDG